jgi:hypothetical protein
MAFTRSQLCVAIVLYLCAPTGIFDARHAGGQQGTSTFFMIVPERKDGIVVLANMDGADVSSLAFELMKLVLSGK